ncbi:MAG TPA: phytoene desaturase family protein [Bacteroidales bacterium]|nr:phytoene desaturase family protein [Bacteroidales bacterium]
MTKVAIIGAGAGGIATAIKLAQNGYQVTVYEKNDTPGGRCGQLIRDGHRFDIGATIFLMPSIYREVFASLGLKLEDSFESKPLPVIYKLHFNGGQTFDFTTNASKMKAQLEKIEPGSFQFMQRYVKIGYHLFKISMEQLLGRNFFHLFEFLNLSNVKLLFKIKTHIRHMTYVKQFFKNPLLQVVFTFQNIYVGQNPYTAPALFSMLPAAELSEGSLYPVGGMYKIIEKLLSVANDLGVEFKYNKSVMRINVDSNQATGLLFEDGSEIQADLIVANADLPYVYKELLPDRLRSFKMNFLKYSCSAIAFHWGLDKAYPQLSHHSVFLSGDYKGGLNKIFKDKTFAESPSFYIHAPVNNDPTAAPEGQDTLSIIVPVGHLDPKKKQDWAELKQIARHGILSRLKAEGFEDLEEHIKFEICYTPKTWENALNVTKGSVFGSISHSIMQMGYFRPHNKHPRYHNLYFVGGSTHPGNGVPLVLLSSKMTSERILKDFNK